MEKEGFKFVAAYDNGGNTLDRFTIVFLPNYDYWNMSHNASSPQGVCQYGGRFTFEHAQVAEFFLNNKRIFVFGELPDAVRHQVKKIEEEYNENENENRV